MKKRYVVLLLLCLSGILGGIVLQYAYSRTLTDTGEYLEEMRDSIKQYETIPPTPSGETEPAETLPPETEPPETESVPESESVTETPPPETEAPDVLPVQQTLDFSGLWEINPDICAWIEIDGTKVDYPILQSRTNDQKYLTTAYDGSYYIGGSLFTESAYNTNDFNDPVTIVYGHTMRNGTLFGQLQTTYSAADTFAECREIKLYLPGEVREYTVFAALPFDSIHILHTYDFSKPYWYRNFFRAVRETRVLGSQMREEDMPSPGDRVLILSTCLSEDSSRRFLVMAVCSADLEQ